MATEQEWERQLAELSEAVYDPQKKTVGDWTCLTDDELRAAKIKPDTLIDDETGLKSGLYKNSQGDIVLAYAGTETWKDVWVDIKQAVGFDTEQYKQAIKLARKANKAFGDKLTFTGHSLGGALATQAAAKTGRPAVVYNPAGLHDNTLKRNRVDPDAFRKQADAGLVKRVVVKGEALDTVQELEMKPSTATAASVLTSTLIGPTGAAIVGLAKTVTDLPDAAGGNGILKWELKNATQPMARCYQMAGTRRTAHRRRGLQGFRIELTRWNHG